MVPSGPTVSAGWSTSTASPPDLALNLTDAVSHSASTDMRFGRAQDLAFPWSTGRSRPGRAFVALPDSQIATVHPSGQSAAPHQGQ